ncbi:choice-of-anchor L domain-containing protein [Marinifilum caeruleilacunae]|uniref:Ig-like domain-containing protein n=1 Tax=Marinifilum caeruleilacunae TaxID=2499076 RepID=A0ABX1X1C1_9BACT|nr:choice-of-anchor L domain-containing protein [Marinifilum caeruleilacunae]NOU61880.1 hypothetical protein [Marinifilum caeruleilacunae]
MLSSTQKTYQNTSAYKIVRAVLLLLIIVCSSLAVNAQVTIWSEDFSDNSNGDTSESGRWTTSGFNGADGNDWFQVRNGKLELRDNNRSVAEWTTTAAIDISAYIDISISIDAQESGGLEPQGNGDEDYILFQYNLDGGGWQNFDATNPWYDDFPANNTDRNASVSGLNGSSLEIRVRMKNGTGNQEYYRIDDILVQGNIDYCAAGSSVIWQEDFEGANQGWTLNNNGQGTISSRTYPANGSGGTGIAGTDLDNIGEWTTNAIDISAYEQMKISMDIGSWGNEMEDVDYLRIYYSVDGGADVLFASNGSHINDISAMQACTDIPDGNTLVIKVQMRNTWTNEFYYMDNVVVSGEPKSTDLVSLSVSPTSINENGGIASITASLVGAQAFPVTVNLSYTGGSGSDYSSASQIVIPAGSTSASTNFTAIDNSINDGDINVVVDITSVINGSEDGVQEETITIVDDDLPSTDPIEVDDKSPENSYSAENLVKNVLVTGCLTTDNIVYSGDETRGLGYFNAGTSDFPLSSGIIISTGDVNSAEGPNTGNSSQNIGDAGNDSDVNALTGNNGNDAQILEFDFVPAGDVLEFRYVFASEEYPEYACSAYNDVFAFIISGPGITADAGLSGKNIALIPGTSNPVTINNVNDNCGNSTYYIDEAGGFATQFDGRTTVLTASANVQPCQTYHIRLIIADVWDASYNSAVFLEAESFKSNEVIIQNGIGVEEDVDVMYEGCSGSFIKFKREEDLDVDLTFDLNISGTAENGVDYIYVDEFGSQIGDGKIPSTVNMSPGVTEVTYYYQAVSDSGIEGDEDLRLSFLKSCPCSAPEYYEKVVTIIDIPEIEASPTSLVSCDGATPVATITVDLKSGLDPADYQYSLDGGPFQDDNVFTLNNPKVGDVYTITVQDRYACRNESFDVTIPGVTPISAEAGPAKSICEGETTQLEGSGGIYYEWACSPASGLSYLSDIYVPNPTVDENIPFGTYTFTLTVKESASATASCVDTDNMVLTVRENSHFTIAADKAEYCSGEVISLSATISNSDAGDTYLWTPTAEVNSPNSANTTVVYNTAALMAKDFSLTITKTNGCSNIEHISGILVNPQPSVSLNASSVVCTNGTSGQLNVDVTGGTPNGSSPFYTYSWSHDGGLNSPNASSLGVGTYTVTVTDSKSCTAQGTFDIGVEPNPVGIYHD